MAKHLTLSKFEALDGALSSFLRADLDADARNWIGCSNRLFDALADVDGYAATDARSSAEDVAERAAEIVTRFLVAA